MRGVACRARFVVLLRIEIILKSHRATVRVLGGSGWRGHCGGGGGIIGAAIRDLAVVYHCSF